MSTNLRRRIEALEDRVGCEAVVLHMPDGSRRSIRGDSKHYFALVALMNSEAESPLDNEIAWLKSAIAIDEEAHEFELLRVLLQGPNREGEEDNVIEIYRSEEGEEDGLR